MAGLLSLLGYKQQNPLLDFLGDHRSTLLGLGAGIAGGGADFGHALGTGLQLASEGSTADYAREAKAAADAKLAANENQTKAWLAKNRPDLADLPVDQAWQVALKDMGSTASAAPASVQEYQFYADQEKAAGREPLSFSDYRKGANTTIRAGLGQPIYGKNRTTGEYMPFEPMSDGSMVSLSDPNAKPSDFIFDPGTVASDRAAGSAYGQAQGSQQYSLPKAAQDIETELGNIDALIANTTGMDQSFGNLGGFNIGGVGFPNQWTPTLPNTPKAGFQAQLAQVAGENFLAAYSTLRGAGAITEAEGQAAKEAMARLSTAQSKEDFIKALTDLKAILVKGYQTMSRQTSGGAYQSNGFTPPPLAGKNYVYNPATGELE